MFHLLLINIINFLKTNEKRPLGTLTFFWRSRQDHLFSIVGATCSSFILTGSTFMIDSLTWTDVHRSSVQD